MAIDVIGANEYFGLHVKAEQWKEFSSPGQKEGAIAKARRDLSRELGRAMDDAAEYREGDRKCDAFAVYEQALFILEQGGVVHGKSSPIQSLAVASEEPEVRPSGVVGKWGPEALRWLGYDGGVMVN